MGRTGTDRLFEVAYDDLCRIARGLRRVPHIPDPAALVHEAYLRFSNRPFGGARDCGVDEFVFVMVLAMKTVARDRRRRESARKRGGGLEVLALDDAGVLHAGRTLGTHTNARHELRDLMQRLFEESPMWFATLMHHDFGGRTIRETARRMGIGESAVRSHRRSAIRWLRSAAGHLDP